LDIGYSVCDFAKGDSSYARLRRYRWIDYSDLGFRISLGVWVLGYFVILPVWVDHSTFTIHHSQFYGVPLLRLDIPCWTLDILFPISLTGLRSSAQCCDAVATLGLDNVFWTTLKVLRSWNQEQPSPLHNAFSVGLNNQSISPGSLLRKQPGAELRKPVRLMGNRISNVQQEISNRRRGTPLNDEW
jgi:hypothetical protein